jgi:hypothetical protein
VLNKYLLLIVNRRNEYIYWEYTVIISIFLKTSLQEFLGLVLVIILIIFCWDCALFTEPQWSQIIDPASSHLSLPILQYLLVSLKFKLFWNWLSASHSWCWSHDQICITVEHLQSSFWVASSLTRGWVRNLLIQFAVTLQSKSRRTHNHILLSHFRLPKPGGLNSHIYIPQGIGFSWC